MREHSKNIFSMGMHDPLEGLVTYNELQAMAGQRDGTNSGPELGREISDMKSICQGMVLTTDDPLGIGGLMFDAFRLVRLVKNGYRQYENLLVRVLDSAQAGLHSFLDSGGLQFPAGNRIPFREFGLSIGFKALEPILAWLGEDCYSFSRKPTIERQVESFTSYVPLAFEIENYWMAERNRKSPAWVDHQGINMMMLATSLEPGGLLGT